MSSQGFSFSWFNFIYMYMYIFFSLFNLQVLCILQLPAQCFYGILACLSIFVPFLGLFFSCLFVIFCCVSFCFIIFYIPQNPVYFPFLSFFYSLIHYILTAVSLPSMPLSPRSILSVSNQKSKDLPEICTKHCLTRHNNTNTNAHITGNLATQQGERGDKSRQKNQTYPHSHCQGLNKPPS